MPFLRERVPIFTKSIEARQFMATNVISLPSVTDMASVKTALQSSHNNFPIINTGGKLVGMISRNTLVVILSHRIFYDKSNATMVERVNHSDMVDESTSKGSLNREDTRSLIEEEVKRNSEGEIVSDRKHSDHFDK